MRISERIEGTIENWRVKWGDTLKEWAASFVSWGIELIMDITGKGLAKQLDSIYDKVAAEQDIPPEVIAKVKNIWKGEGQWQMMLGSAAGGTAVGSLIGSTIGPWLKLVEYMGLGIAKPFRLDPGSIITAWRRDKAKYEKLFDDLREQGWTEDRIEALKFVTLHYPSPGELVLWQAREVFEPEMVEKYGLDAELGEVERDAFYKAGMTDEQIKNYWRAHWEHPALTRVFDMLHRGEITPEEMYRYYRVVEIPPYWRDKLTVLSWDLPNRIETRMMARYGLVDKSWLVNHLEKIGLHEDYRSITADFMLAMGIRMDLSKRYRYGWLDEEGVRSEIATFGLSEDIADRLYKWIVKNEQPERVTKERDLTKTDIYRGVKKGTISELEGIELLQDLGYSRDEAEYIIEINVTAAEGSPETYSEFKQMTQLYRKAMGLKAELLPQELIEASKALAEAKKALEQVRTKERKDITETEAMQALSAAEYRYKQLLTQWQATKKS